jgi:hypothetical protein
MTAAKTVNPVEIDTELAALWGHYAELGRTLDSVVSDLHYDANDKKIRVGRSTRWAMSTTEAVTAAQTRLDAGEVKSWDVASATRALTRYADLVAHRAMKREEIAVLDAVYDAAPWSRFFEVTSSDGHIHSSMSCSTCNNGRYMTDFVWHPELSGLTEADAVKALGPILCSVCFASAPISWQQSRAEVRAAADKASGLYCDGTMARDIKWRNSPYGTCTTCEQTVSVTSTGKARKHKKEAGK